MILFPRVSVIKPLLLLFICFGVRAFAQFRAATVAGVVQDSSKAAIIDAKLKLINTQTGAENDATTNPEGQFLLPGIIPGGYTLQIECDGFATTQVNGLVLSSGDIKNLLIRFGATLGAPIILPRIYNGRDKSFVFLSYEGLY